MIEMHKEAVPENVLFLLKRIKPIVIEIKAVLAGGTALALQIGHRISVDLDFFTSSDFENEKILATLKKRKKPIGIIEEKEGTLSLLIEDIKLSFFKYPYPFIEPLPSYENIPLAGILDIASMKVLAIIQRGTKRDFADLYFILLDMPFHKVAANMVSRFGADRINPIVMGKALVYFSDADSNPDPNFVEGKDVSWTDIKKFFRDRVKPMVLELDKTIEKR